MQRLRLHFVSANCHIQLMPLPDFTEEERAEVIQAIRAAIDGDR